MTLSIQQRLDYYIGNTDYENQQPNNPDGKSLFLFDGTQNTVTYQEDVIRLFNLSKSKALWFKCSDARYTGPHYPVLTKTRDTHDPESKGIIAPLEYSRHFGICPQIKNIDISWERKKNKLIWRGSSTGIEKDNRVCSRLDFVKMYYDKFDVGLSLPANNWYKTNQNVFAKYYRHPISIAEQLCCKYIPILDGNDKASGLNWVLSSNSVPMMPKPRFHSWLCEKFLQPNVHYIELNEDYSNLEEKLQWCADNDKTCNEIAVNGKHFMSLFTPQKEQIVEKNLMSVVDDIYNTLNKSVYHDELPPIFIPPK